MMMSNTSFNKTWGKLKNKMTEGSDAFKLSKSEDCWDVDSPKKETDLFTLTQEMDSLVEKMLLKTNEFGSPKKEKP
jgi:hypothetical protein